MSEQNDNPYTKDIQKIFETTGLHTVESFQTYAKQYHQIFTEHGPEATRIYRQALIDFSNDVIQRKFTNKLSNEERVALGEEYDWVTPIADSATDEDEHDEDKYTEIDYFLNGPLEIQVTDDIDESLNTCLLSKFGPKTFYEIKGREYQEWLSSLPEKKREGKPDTYLVALREVGLLDSKLNPAKSDSETVRRMIFLSEKPYGPAQEKVPYQLLQKLVRAYKTFNPEQGTGPATMEHP